MRAVIQLAILLNILLQGTISEQWTLKLPTFVPLTGNLPFTGFECIHASKYAVDLAKKQFNALPSYKIEQVILDEGQDGSLTARNGVNFFRQTVSDQNSSILSPLILGGYYSTGCKALGGVVHHMNTVLLGMKCSSYLLTNRKAFPYLFLSLATSDFSTYGYLNFIHHFGKWRSIAIIFYLGNVIDTTTAKLTYEQALMMNMSVPYFAGFMELSDVGQLIPLKKSDARVIVLWVQSPIMHYEFYCHSFRLGMTGPRYTFFTQLRFTAKALTGVPGCTAEMINEQLKSAILAQPTTSPLKTTIRTQTFEESLDAATNRSRGTDHQLRYMCVDGTFAGVMALDAAEKRLQAMNLSLRNYGSHPEIVSFIVRDSLAKLDVQALRTERFKYGTTGKFGADVLKMQRWMWPNESTDTPVAYFRQRDGTSGLNWSDYWIEKAVAELPWYTANNKPPNDRTQLKFITEDTSLALLIFVAVFNVANQFIFNGKLLYHLYHDDASKMTERRLKFIGSLGTSCMNFAAVLFSIPDHYVASTVALWKARFILSIIGISLTNGSLIVRALLYKVLKMSQTIFNDAIRMEKKMMNILYAFLLANIAAIIIWLVPNVTIDPLECQRQQWPPASSEIVVYDEISDQAIFWLYDLCVSQMQVAWLLGLAGFHALLLLLGLFFAYETRSILKTHKIKEHGLFTAGLANAALLLVAGVIILITLGNNANPIIAIRNQKTAFAIMISLFSLSTNMTWILPQFKFYTLLIAKNSKITTNANREIIKAKPSAEIYPRNKLSATPSVAKHSSNAKNS